MMHIQMKTEVMHKYKAQQYLVTYGSVASIAQPRQLGTTNILIQAPLSGLLCVLTSYQDGYYTQIISLTFLWCSSLLLKYNSYHFQKIWVRIF